MSRTRGTRWRGIRLRTWLILIAVLGLLLALCRSWGKDEWLFALLILTLIAVYLGLDYSDEIIK